MPSEMDGHTTGQNPDVIVCDDDTDDDEEAGGLVGGRGGDSTGIVQGLWAGGLSAARRTGMALFGSREAAGGSNDGGEAVDNRDIDLQVPTFNLPPRAASPPSTSVPAKRALEAGFSAPHQGGKARKLDPPVTTAADGAAGSDVVEVKTEVKSEDGYWERDSTGNRKWVSHSTVSGLIAERAAGSEESARVMSYNKKEGRSPSKLKAPLSRVTTIIYM